MGVPSESCGNTERTYVFRSWGPDGGVALSAAAPPARDTEPRAYRRLDQREQLRSGD